MSNCCLVLEFLLWIRFAQILLILVKNTYDDDFILYMLASGVLHKFMAGLFLQPLLQFFIRMLFCYFFQLLIGLGIKLNIKNTVLFVFSQRYYSSRNLTCWILHAYARKWHLLKLQENSKIYLVQFLFNLSILLPLSWVNRTRDSSRYWKYNFLDVLSKM